MEQTEQSKHEQWSGMFGDEWVPKWVYPNHIVKDGDQISIDSMTFKVLDIGSGGDCDANAIWLLEGANPVAFVGDFLYRGNHTYMADGNVLRWLANLEKYAPTLQSYNTYYIGHGTPCTFEDIHKQKQYMLDYCAEILHATGGSAIFTDETLSMFDQRMTAKYPTYGCQFMVELSAERVAAEIKSLSE